MPYLFTVFTATYNRSHLLHRVYDSLCAQTCGPCFEWLIVDDGSTDNTRDRVEAWASEASFPIRYVRQLNGGQHMACNRGLRLARGELFAMIDSDDAAMPQALARFAQLWDSIPVPERHGYAGVGGLCSDETGRLIGDRFPQDCYDASILKLTFGDRVAGQKWWCTRTEVLRRFPWAETSYKAPNPWFSISEHYRWRLANEVFKIFYQDNPEESISRAKGNLRPQVLLRRHEDWLNRYLNWFAYHPAEFVRIASHYSRYSLHLGRSLSEQARRLPPGGQLLWAAALPMGFALWLRDKQRRVTIKL